MRRTLAPLLLVPALIGCRVEGPIDTDGAANVASTATPLLTDGKADGLFGQPDYASSAAPSVVSGTTTSHPTGVAADASFRNPSYVLVIDREASRGLMFSSVTTSWSLSGLYGQTAVTNGLANQGLPSPHQQTLHTPTTAAFVTAMSEIPGSINWIAVADTANHRVLASNNIFGTFSATMVLGQGGSFTSGIPSNGGVHKDSLEEPSGVAWEPTTNPARLYVADTAHHRILRFEGLAAGTAPGAAAVFGQTSFGDAAENAGLGKAHARGLSRPMGLAGWFLSTNVGDPLRGLWVADSGNHRVVHLSQTGVADFVLGQPDLESNTPNAFGASARSLRGPTAVAVDPRGRVYVADTGNHRVLRFPKGATTADLVLGQPSFDAIAPPTATSERTLFLPSGVAVAGNGDVFVADTGASRILRYSPSCSEPGACDDGDPCTEDTCDPTYRCFHALTIYAKECAPYTCTVALRRCATACDGSRPCAPGRTCVSGRCLVPCAIDEQCVGFGGHCADGVCCDAPCKGACESCRASGREGQCVPLPAGAQPTAPKACPGGSSGCSRACDGTNRAACRPDPKGTTCGVAACIDGVESAIGRCDGEGTCEASTKPCGAYACAAAACRSRCDFDHDCAAGFSCMDGVCTTSRGRGAGCSAAPGGEASLVALALSLLSMLSLRARRRR